MDLTMVLIPTITKHTSSTDPYEQLKTDHNWNDHFAVWPTENSEVPINLIGNDCNKSKSTYFAEDVKKRFNSTVSANNKADISCPSEASVNFHQISRGHRQNKMSHNLTYSFVHMWNYISLLRNIKLTIGVWKQHVVQNSCTCETKSETKLDKDPIYSSPISWWRNQKGCHGWGMQHSWKKWEFPIFQLANLKETDHLSQYIK